MQQIIKHISAFGQKVQWLEHVLSKQEVVGSNPIRVIFLYGMEIS